MYTTRSLLLFLLWKIRTNCPPCRTRKNSTVNKGQVMASQLKLYGYWRSSATWRVRIALHHKSIPFTYHPVHLVHEGGEQHSPAYTRLNPLAQVPTLELEPGVHLTQSLAIIDYLEQMYPESPLYPSAPLERARALQYAELVNSGIQPLQNLSLLQRLTRDCDIDKLAWGRRVITDGLNALEQLVTDHERDRSFSSTFLVGASPSVADLCLIPQLYNARRFGVDLAQLPRLSAAESACEALAAFTSAHPDAQADAQL